MSVCGQSPLFIPTTVNAIVKNIDAVDVAATNLSCTNLTVKGNPISDVFQNVTATPGNTAFTGGVTATSITATTTTSNTLAVSGTTTLGDVNVSSLTASNTVTSATLNAGAVNASSNIIQTAGTTTLKATTADSLTVTNTSTLATITLNSPYLINLGGGLKLYGAVAVTGPTLSQTSSGASPVVYTNTYTFSVTSTNLPILSSTNFIGKLVAMVTATTAGLQAYGEFVVNKGSTTPTVTVFDATQQNSWSSFTVTATSASALSVVVSQAAPNTPPATVTPTLQLMFTLYDF
jgi:hypothetical protein